MGTKKGKNKKSRRKKEKQEKVLLLVCKLLFLLQLLIKCGFWAHCKEYGFIVAVNAFGGIKTPDKERMIYNSLCMFDSLYGES